MFDFLRNLTKSADEKRQEQLNAYVSDGLSAREREQFETLLAADADLRAEVEALRQLRQQMRQMPRRRVPRSFTLDPALYSKPKRQPLLQYEPVMRVATVMTAVFLIIAVGAEFLTFGTAAEMVSEPQAAESVAMDDAAMDEATAEEAPVELTAVVETETVVEEVMEEEMVEEEAELEVLQEEAVAETMAEEEMADDAEAEDGDAFAAEPYPAPAGTLAADTPRIVATPDLGDRMIEGESDIETTLELVETPVVLNDVVEEGVPETAVDPPQTEDDFAATIPTSPELSPLRLTQIGLVIILAGLLMLLYAARLQK